jgi:hypothetical protein
LGAASLMVYGTFPKHGKEGGFMVYGFWKGDYSSCSMGLRGYHKNWHRLKENTKITLSMKVLGSERMQATHYLVIFLV